VTHRGRTWSGRVIGALALTAFLAGVPPLYSQQPATDTAAVAGEHLTVRLITAGPGSEVWELFGHNAIWIKDQTTGREIVYDYGRFDFAEPGFLSRFVKGRMLYWMGAADPRGMISAYIRRDRTVWVQELNLPPAARAELLRFLEHNVLEENRYYRYASWKRTATTATTTIWTTARPGSGMSWTWSSAAPSAPSRRTRFPARPGGPSPTGCSRPTLSPTPEPSWDSAAQPTGPSPAGTRCTSP